MKTLREMLCRADLIAMVGKQFDLQMDGRGVVMVMDGNQIVGYIVPPEVFEREGFGK